MLRVTSCAWLPGIGAFPFLSVVVRLFCPDCVRTAIPVRSWITVQSWRDSSTGPPARPSSSIYPGGFVKKLRWDCGRIVDCVGIETIAIQAIADCVHMSCSVLKRSWNQMDCSVTVRSSCCCTSVQSLSSHCLVWHGVVDKHLLNQVDCPVDV